MSQLDDKNSFNFDGLDKLVKKFSERAAESDRKNEINLENIADLRQAGYLSLTLPKDKGGQDISLYQIADIVAKVAQGDPSTALILAMQYLQTIAILASTTWPEEVRNEVIESVASGALVNALRVEPQLGTPARGGIPATRVRKEGDKYFLSGRKIFSTGSNALHWGVVWGATEEEEPKIGQILVPLDSPGVRIEKTWHQLGMRATGSDTIIFENVEIPERYLINFTSQKQNPETPMLAIWHTVMVPVLYNAIILSARKWLISFLENRVPTALGRPLSTLPRFHSVLGEIDGLILTNDSLLERALKKTADQTITLTEAGQVKRLVTENAIKAVEIAISVTGNPGLSQDNPLERHYRDVLCGRIHTPQADSILEKAGKEAFEK